MNLTLEEVVREYLIESFGAMQVDNRFARYYQLGVSGMREIHSDVGHKKSYAMMPLRDNNTASLPLDYISYYRIGICSGNEILAFAENQDSCPISMSLDDCGQIQARVTGDDSISSNSELFLSSNSADSYSKDGQYVGREFGARGGKAVFGEFQINEDEGYVYVESSAYNIDSLIIEYASILPKSGDGNIIVHPYETEAIKAWIYWKSIQRVRSYSQSEKEIARMTFGVEKKKSRMRRNAITIQDVIGALRKGYGAAPGI
jgi:hypothetical protein